MAGHKRAATASSIEPQLLSKKPPASQRVRTPKAFRFIKRSKSVPAVCDETRSHDGGQTESSTRDDERSRVSPPLRPALNGGPASSLNIFPSSNVSVNIDDGIPSSSPFKDLHRVLKLIEDERHLVAHNLFLDARRRIEESRNDCVLDVNGGSPKFGKSYRKKKGGIQREETNTQNTQSRGNMTNRDDAWKLLQEKEEEFRALENRANLFISAKENLSIDDDWTLAQSLFGVTTYYRREADESLSVKIEGELHGIPLFEQLVVLRECDLYHTWAPFMQKSKKLAQLDKLDVVAWYIVGAPLLGLTRDACYRAVGCDCMKEEGSVLLVAVGLNDSLEHGVKQTLSGDNDAQSDSGTVIAPKPDLISERVHSDGYTPRVETQLTQVQRQQLYEQRARNMDSSILVDTNVSSFLSRDAILETIEIPPIPEGLGRGRMTIRNFSACVDILSPTSARSKMVVNVDPNLNFIPQYLIDFCMKRMCGVLLSRLQATARKVVKDPIKNPHSRRMREDVRFYRDWLLPKFRIHCDQLGWTMPPVAALSVSEEDLKAAGIFEEWRADYEVASHSTQQLHDDEKNHSIESLPSSGIDGSSLASKTSRSSRFEKLGNAFHQRGVHASMKREMKIATARERAATRLQPAQFSDSKLVRLRELKAAKLRAGERNQSQGMNSSTLSICSPWTFRDSDDDKVLKRHTLLFVITLVFNLLLIPLRPYVVARVSLSSSFSSFSQVVIRLLLPNLIVCFMVLLQSVTMYSLLNSSLIFAFECIDFGQKEIVKNLDYGKKFYIDSIKKYTFISAVISVAISTGVALIQFLFQRTLKNACSVLSGDVAARFIQWWTLQLEGDRLLSEKTSYFFDVVGRTFVTLFEGMCHVISYQVFAVLQRLFKAMNGVVHTLGLAFPLALRNAWGNFYQCVVNLLSSNISFCELEKDVESWRQRALEISTFVTTRACVFVLSFLLMAHLLLPKPEDLAREVGDGSKGTHFRRGDTVEDYITEVSPSRARILSKPTSSEIRSSMDVISEEERSH
mmetsp:Transcript_17203/g.35921  ORF Transcript_17203/g.35921 Transcript_17203/m.35921 type:complete len:1023 (-) Transcript_17203:21-3089(-)